MSPTGHKFTAAALAVVLSAPIASSEMYFEAAIMFAAVMFGARAPDWLEIARWEDGVRRSLIPHRGPTHWPGWYIIGLVAAFTIPNIPSLLSYAMIGFFSSALLHLVMDIMTPTGIPFWGPFGKKKSFNVYKTGSFISEGFIICMTAGLAAIYSLPHLKALVELI